MHQFSKVEIFAVSEPEGSEDMYNEIVEIQTEMFDELGLHFRVLNMPSEELGGPAYCKVDMEAWMPARGEFGEISSSSNCTDYQARRLNIRYKSYPKQRQQHPQDGDDSGSVRVTGDVCDGKVTASNKNSAKPVNRFVHTLNGTACAVPRMMIAIMEQNQQADGSIRVPDALQPFMMGIQSIPHAPMHVQHVTC